MGITFDDPVLGPAGPPDATPRRRRMIAAITAAVVAAVALGAGFAVGRSTGTGEGTASASPGTVPEGATTAAASPVDVADTEPPVPVTTVVIGDDASSSYVGELGGVSVRSWTGPGGTVGSTLFGPFTMPLLTERTTDDGDTLRVHLAQQWEMSGDSGIDGWQPAPWCFENGQIRVALEGNGVIDVGAVGWYREPYLGRSVAPVLLGVADGLPRWVFVVQVPADATGVSVAGDGGATDAATPQGGVAVLTLPAPAALVDQPTDDPWAPPPPPVYQVTIDGGSAAGVLTSDGAGTWADEEYQAACQPPPPALPEPGIQPADPAADEQAVADAMTTLYDETFPGDREDLVDDATGVAEARQQVADGTYGDQAAAATATVEELVFTSPTEAWFRYRIDTPQSTFDNRYGVARLVDGAWKITRDTICQDLSLAGGDCGGGWSPVIPPSAHERPIDLMVEAGEVWSSSGE